VVSNQPGRTPHHTHQSPQSNVSCGSANRLHWLGPHVTLQPKGHPRPADHLGLFDPPSKPLALIDVSTLAGDSRSSASRSTPAGPCCHLGFQRFVRLSRRAGARSATRPRRLHPAMIASRRCQNAVIFLCLSAPRPLHPRMTDGVANRRVLLLGMSSSPPIQNERLWPSHAPAQVPSNEAKLVSGQSAVKPLNEAAPESESCVWSTIGPAGCRLRRLSACWGGARGDFWRGWRETKEGLPRLPLRRVRSWPFRCRACLKCGPEKPLAGLNCCLKRV